MLHLAPGRLLLLLLLHCCLPATHARMHVSRLQRRQAACALQQARNTCVPRSTPPRKRLVVVVVGNSCHTSCCIFTPVAPTWPRRLVRSCLVLYFASLCSCWAVEPPPCAQLSSYTRTIESLTERVLGEKGRRGAMPSSARPFQRMALDFERGCLATGETVVASCRTSHHVFPCRPLGVILRWI